MAEIHDTTVKPSKLELLAPWLPGQPWYAGGRTEPVLSKVGGFRLDDPAGEVGLEFMAVTDSAGHAPVTYHVPLAYRGAPLEGCDDALVGTMMHGVLGRRWIYDGMRDPVLLERLRALLQGRAEPQAQNVSDTPDPTVTRHVVASGHGERGEQPDAGVLDVVRVLRPGEPEEDDLKDVRAYIATGWRVPGDEGARMRGVWALWRDGSRRQRAGRTSPVS
jgi:hypothetical protein